MRRSLGLLVAILATLGLVVGAPALAQVEDSVNEDVQPEPTPTDDALDEPTEDATAADTADDTADTATATQDTDATPTEPTEPAMMQNACLQESDAQADDTGIDVQTDDESDEEAIDVASLTEADVRSRLASLLQERTFLTGFATEAGLNQGFSSETFQGTLDAVQANAQDLSNFLGAFIGEQDEERLEELLRRRAESLINLAQARATNNQDLADTARQNLSQVRDAIATLLAESNPALDAQQLTQALDRRLEQTLSALQAFADGNADAVTQLRTIAIEPGLAEMLTQALLVGCLDRQLETAGVATGTGETTATETPTTEPSPGTDDSGFQTFDELDMTDEATADDTAADDTTDTTNTTDDTTTDATPDQIP